MSAKMGRSKTTFKKDALNSITLPFSYLCS